MGLEIAVGPTNGRYYLSETIFIATGAVHQLLIDAERSSFE